MAKKKKEAMAKKKEAKAAMQARVRERDGDDGDSCWPRDLDQHAFEPPNPALQPRLDHVHLRFRVIDSIDLEGSRLLPGAWLAVYPPEVDPGIGLVLLYRYQEKWSPGQEPLIVGIADYPRPARCPVLVQTTMPSRLDDLRAIGVPSVASWREWWLGYEKVPPPRSHGIADTTSAGDKNT